MPTTIIRAPAASRPYIGLRLKTRLPKPDGINLTLTPLLDLLFLLFIFFMVGSSLVFQQGLPVDLPSVEEPDFGFADKLVISLTKNNLLYFNDQQVDGFNDLENTLSSVVYSFSGGSEAEGQEQVSRRPIILVKADADAPYSDVARIMSISRKYGASVLLQTKDTTP